MEEQLRLLKREVKTLKLIIGLICLGAMVCFIRSFTSDDKSILKARGLIIEDEHGMPFIMMGSPAPYHAHRKRKDSLRGIVFLDSSGVDRLFIGRDGKLQIGGELVDRNSAGWSYLINDTTGDERGGFGFSDDDDQIGLGLDYGGKDGLEAIYLNASNDNAYVVINGNVTKGVRDRIVLWHDVKKDLSMIKLADKSMDEKVVIKTRSGLPELSYADSSGKRINVAK